MTYADAIDSYVTYREAAREIRAHGLECREEATFDGTRIFVDGEYIASVENGIYAGRDILAVLGY